MELLYQPGSGTLGPLYAAVQDANGEVKQLWMSEENGLRHVTISITGVKEPEFVSIATMMAERDEVLEVSPSARKPNFPPDL